MRVWEVCHPYPEVLEGRLKEQSFVVNAGGVWERLELDATDVEVDPRYLDPRGFVERTFFTGAIREILQTVARRLRGQDVQAVHHLKVGMGGGKSHTLLLLYYMIRRPDEVLPTMEREGIDARVPQGSRVVVIDGSRLDPIRGYPPLGVKTLWGLLLRQLGDPAAEEHDSWDSVPSVQVLKEALLKAPTLVMIDELTFYVENVRADPDKVEKVRLFLQALTTAVHETLGSALVVATPVGVYQKALEMVSAILGRYSEPRILASGEEYRNIRRRALFSDDFLQMKDEISSIASEVCEDVRRHAPKFSHACPGEFEQNYPFHPFVDATMTKLKSNPAFQEVRDELRFLASLVYSVFTRRPEDAYFITVGHADLRDQYVRGGTISKLRDPTLEARASQDLERLSQVEDESLRRLAESVLTAIVLNSLPRDIPTSLGLTEDEAIFALLSPQTPPDQIRAALRECGRRLWFVSLRDGRWVFGSPNLNKLVSDYVDRVQRDPAMRGAWWEEIKEELEKWRVDAIRGYRAAVSDRKEWKTRLFQDRDIILWPSGPDDVPDDRSPKLILLDYRIPEDGSPNAGFTPRVASTVDEAVEAAREFFESYSATRERKYRNTVFFLVADRELVEREDGPKRRATTLLALEQMERDRENLERVIGPAGLRNVDSMVRTERARLRQSCYVVYRYLVYPSRSGLSAVELGQERIDPKSFLYNVEKELREDLRKVVDSITAEALVERYWPARDRVEVEELIEGFYRRPELELVTREEAIKEAIRGAVVEGKISYTYGGKTYFREDPGRLDPKGILNRRVREVSVSISVEDERTGEAIPASLIIDGRELQAPTEWKGLEGSQVTVRLEVPDGYELVGWSDGESEEERTIELVEGLALRALLRRKALPPQQWVKVTFRAVDVERNVEVEPWIRIANKRERIREGGIELDLQRGVSYKLAIEVPRGYEFVGWSDRVGDEEREVAFDSDTTLIARLKPLKRGTKRLRWSESLEKAERALGKYYNYEAKAVTFRLKGLRPDDYVRVAGAISRLFKPGTRFEFEAEGVGRRGLGLDMRLTARGDEKSIERFRSVVTQLRDYLEEVAIELKAEFSEFVPLREAISGEALKALGGASGLLSFSATVRATAEGEEGRAVDELIEDFRSQEGP